MRGRQVLVESLKLHDCSHIFGNPGTTENPLLEALLGQPDIQYITTLHEGVAVCAAGFYAQATGKTPLANVHVAPGLGNAIGMMYGCLKSRVPVVVTAGQQDVRMRLREPLLSHDLVAMATPVVKWSAQPQTADEIAPIMQRAFQIANQHPKGPVFVALPNNVLEAETQVSPTTAGLLHQPSGVSQRTLNNIAEKLTQAEKVAICVGDDVAAYGAIEPFLALTDLLGAGVFTDFLLARRPISTDHPNYVRALATDASQNRSMLSEYDAILVIGGVTMEEIWYEPGSSLPERAYTLQIEIADTLLALHRPINEGISGDLSTTLTDLLSALQTKLSDADRARFAAQNQARAEQQDVALTAQAVRFEKLEGASPMAASEAMSALASALPQDIVLVDESITASADVDRAFRKGAGEDFFAGRGGGIGQGIAGALGVAVGQPEKTVVAVSGDGSAMYSIQALWTAAHHDLKILFVILANAEYRVLKHNLDIHRQRFDAPSDQAYPFMDLTHPTLGFVGMAEGMGLQATRAESPEDIRTAATNFVTGNGPHLLEITIAGKS